MNSKKYYIYILANKTKTTLYIGVTSKLRKRIYDHKNKVKSGFSSKYNVNRLVYYEVYGEVGQALFREKTMKRWKREWKENLINKENAGWKDLYEEVYDD